MTTLEEIRQKLIQQDKNSSPSNNNPNEVYAFWNIDIGDTATIRFLPDGNANNTFFWVERQIIKLTFDGIVGGEKKEVTVQVPCNEMWEARGSCPILSEIRPWFKDPELEQLARKYWVKRSYIFQGFVVNSPMAEDNLPDNPIRRFVLNKGLFDIVKSSLMDPEMEDLPIDYISGRDFKIVKSKRGQYADYSTSSWSMRARSLSDDEQAAIEQYGLNDLNSFLPNKPTEDGLVAIKEMFEASVNGDAYDPSRWAQFYKPFGLETNNDSTETKTTVSKPTEKPKATEPAVEPPEHDDEPEHEDVAPVKEVVKEKEVEESSDTPDPKDIIARLKARQKG